jgi:hypothetical protein
VFVVLKARGHHEHIPQLEAIPRQVNTVIIIIIIIMQIGFTQASGFCILFKSRVLSDTMEPSSSRNPRSSSEDLLDN